MAEVQRLRLADLTPSFRGLTLRHSTSLLLPLLCFSCGLAYSLFISGSLAAYFLTLRRIACESYVPILIITFPALIINIRCGQNGFLTGALIGLTCLYLRKGSALAGLPLGLMIIKPHLAIALAVYAIANRRWKVVAIALATAIADHGRCHSYPGHRRMGCFFPRHPGGQRFSRARLLSLISNGFILFRRSGHSGCRRLWR